MPHISVFKAMTAFSYPWAVSSWMAISFFHHYQGFCIYTGALFVWCALHVRLIGPRLVGALIRKPPRISPLPFTGCLLIHSSAEDHGMCQLRWRVSWKFRGDQGLTFPLAVAVRFTVLLLPQSIGLGHRNLALVDADVGEEADVFLRIIFRALIFPSRNIYPPSPTTLF